MTRMTRPTWRQRMMRARALARLGVVLRVWLRLRLGVGLGVRLGVGLGVWLGAFNAAAGATAAETLDALRVQASEPRAYGYQVGELVPRQVTVHAPQGWRLIEDSLPRPGGRGGAIELRRIATEKHTVSGGQRYDLALEYQVLLAPVNVRTIEIAPLRLRFEHATRAEELRVEAWPITVAPLTPPEVSPRRGLGELQPDRSPPLIDSAAIRLRLLVCAGLVVLLLGAVAALTFGPPWHAARHRPFGRAWRELRRLPLRPDATQWQAACRTLHRALNECAGEVLFEPGLQRFVTAQPRFRDVRDGLSRFMRMSREEFFGNATHAGGSGPHADRCNGARATADAAWLVDLCRRCRDADRGWDGAA